MRYNILYLALITTALIFTAGELAGHLEAKDAQDALAVIEVDMPAMGESVSGKSEKTKIPPNTVSILFSLFC